jgi:hypothetical protein
MDEKMGERKDIKIYKLHGRGRGGEGATRISMRRGEGR